MRVLFVSILSALTLLHLAISGALAEPVSYPNATDPLPVKPDLTYADLIGLVVPPAPAEGTTAADQPVRIRHIGGGDDTAVESGEVQTIASVDLHSGGQDRIALLLDMGEPVDALGLAILALFDVSGDPKLLDAADVSFDRLTSFAEPAKVAVSASDDLLVTVSSHGNAGQSYAIVSPILVRGDHFEEVDEIFILGEWNCSYSRTQSVSIGKGAGDPFADIVATVTDQSVASNEDCGDSALPLPESRTITVTYRWDSTAQKYVPDSDAFEILARENEDRL